MHRCVFILSVPAFFYNMQRHTHIHIHHFPFRSWENDNKKACRPSQPLTSDPWRSPTDCAGGGGGMESGVIKGNGCGGALRKAPSVRPTQAASWVSSPSSVHWPLSCPSFPYTLGCNRCLPDVSFPLIIYFM